GGDQTAVVETDKVNQALVLGNRVMVGSVNAGPEHVRMGVDDLIKAELLYSDWLDQLLTTKIDGFDCAAIIHALETNRAAIKMFVEVSQ
ncbi:MAG: hypothetical protein NZ518_11475, partial [Dehalococcoidia bacterium]|nr:hypothetical protein [Dehalococcoidia bacterium]